MKPLKPVSIHEKQITKEFGSVKSFNDAIQSFVSAKHATARVEGAPAPSAHFLVEQVVGSGKGTYRLIKAKPKAEPKKDGE